jgi:branched-chain amino acid transport system substrate-binding protein
MFKRRYFCLVILPFLFVSFAAFADEIEQKFERAEDYFAEKDYGLAASLYLAVIEAEPQGPYASFSALRIGMCHFARGEYKDAAASLEKFDEGFTDSRYRDDAAYLAARSYFEMGSNVEATRKLLFIVGYGEGNVYYRRAAKGIADIYDGAMAPDDMRIALSEYHRNISTGQLLYLLSVHEYKKEDYERCVVVLEELTDNYEGSEFYEKAEDLLEKVRDALGRRADAIGLLVPLTGDFEIYGKQIKYAAQIAFDNYNDNHPDKRISLYVEDTAGNPETARLTARKLVYNDRVIAIIGPCLTGEIESVSSVTTPAEVPILSPTAGTSEISRISEYVFQNGLTYQIETKAMAEYAINRMKVKTFSILYPNNNYGKEHAEAFKTAVKDLGGEIRKEVEYPTIDTSKEPDEREINYSPYTKRIKEGRALGLYIPGHSTEIIRLLPQLTFSDVNSFYYGSNGWNEHSIVRISGKYIEGCYYTAAFYEDSSDEKTRSFIAQYRRKVGEMPKYLAAQAYDAALIMLRALESDPGDGEDMKRALEDIRDFDGVTGKTTLRGDDGNLHKEITVLTVHEGEVMPAER